MAISDTRTLTINTKIKSSAFTAEELSFLDVYLNHYNHIKFITTSKLKKQSLDGLKIGDVKYLCDRIHQNDKEKLEMWRKQWNALSYRHMLFVGSTDESLGNSNANINLNTNNKFILNITVPVALKKGQFRFSKLSVPITVYYYEHELRNHILFHREVYAGIACWMGQNTI